MNTRNISEEDYYRVKNVLNEWWGGRQMTHLLQKLFFEHFQSTSFIVEDDRGVVAFLIGFVSQTSPDEAYIHFIGVNPEHRKKGIARNLYNLFFSKVLELGCKRVKCITSPINERSLAYHKAMGFSVTLGKDYEGLGEDRLLFSKSLIS